MKFLSFPNAIAASVLYTVLTFFMLACNKYPDFKKSDTGLYYRFFNQNVANRALEVNDILYVNMDYFTDKDSLIFSSSELQGREMIIQVNKPLYKGDINEGLAMMHVGDSAAFIVSADSFFIHNAGMPLPPEIKSGSRIKFHIGVKNAQSKEEFDRENERRQVEAKLKMDEARDNEPQLIQEYLERKGIKAKPTSSGLYYVETSKGNGPRPRKGQFVTVHYAGFLTNGKKFDSSYDRGEPIVFQLGEGQVIGGWDEAIALMQVGTEAQLIIPSVLAYGSNGSRGIPPFSPLVFDVQLIKISDTPPQDSHYPGDGHNH